MATILGISGSLGEKSTSRVAMYTVLEQVETLGGKAHAWDLATKPLEMLNPENRNPSVNHSELKKLVLEADAILLATPDYHGGPTGALKNCLDHFWKEFGGKLFGYICASHEKGLTAMDQLRTSVRQCYGWSLPYGVSLTDADVEGGQVTHAAVTKRLHMLAYDLHTYGPLLKSQFENDRSSSGEAGFAVHYRR